MKVHKSVTYERVEEVVREAQVSLDNPGICIVCGADADGCEPDARAYECEECGARAVYGVEELLVSGLVRSES